MHIQNGGTRRGQTSRNALSGEAAEKRGRWPAVLLAARLQTCCQVVHAIKTNVRDMLPECCGEMTPWMAIEPGEWQWHNHRVPGDLAPR